MWLDATVAKVLCSSGFSSSNLEKWVSKWENNPNSYDPDSLNELRHLSIKESQQKGADVTAVHVGIRHDDDTVVAQFIGVVLFLANTGAECLDEGDNFLRRN